MPLGQTKSFKSHAILLLLFLSNIAISPHAVAQARDADIDEVAQLEFPVEGDWTSTNDYGVLKWMRPFKYEVRSESPYESTAVKRDLAGMLRLLPPNAQALAFDGNAEAGQSQLDTADVLIWITNTPWADCRGLLRPFLSKLAPTTADVDAAASRAEAAGQNVFAKFAFDRYGALTGAILVVDAQRVSGDQLLGVTRRFLLSSMNPRLFSIEDSSVLISSSADGELGLTIPVLRLFSAIYDFETRSGATEAQFRDIIRKQIKQANLGIENKLP
jgi:hypothetical protein